MNEKQYKVIRGILLAILVLVLVEAGALLYAVLALSHGW